MKKTDHASVIAEKKPSVTSSFIPLNAYTHTAEGSMNTFGNRHK
ncbi:hypothetical protein [Olivibacter sp. SDN3]|nr:hypothetical protein [Olivibacter sp. SDN3]